MRRCFALAKQAMGMTSPNPYVGAVIIKDDKILGEGYHLKSGNDHAELAAIKNAQVDLSGATLYCNLEPCCHTHKKTPPCVPAIIEAGIQTVVIANLDPNPAVAGKGVEQLKAAGLEVITDVLTDEGAILNEVFFHHISENIPFIHLKWAQTLDGKIATNSYNSKWITGEVARSYAHHERKLYDAIMVGAGTVNTDNPRLTVRLTREMPKKRIVLSRSGSVNLGQDIFNDQYKNYTYLVVGEDVDISYDGNLLRCPIKNNKFDMDALLSMLYREGIHSIYVEGGAQVIRSFLTEQRYNRLSIYVAPKILGDGIAGVQGFEPTQIDEAMQFGKGRWVSLGTDILFESQGNICLQV